MNVGYRAYGGGGGGGHDDPPMGVPKTTHLAPMSPGADSSMLGGYDDDDGGDHDGAAAAGDPTETYSSGAEDDRRRRRHHHHDEEGDNTDSSSSINRFLDRVRSIRKTTKGNPFSNGNSVSQQQQYRDYRPHPLDPPEGGPARNGNGLSPSPNRRPAVGPPNGASPASAPAEGEGGVLLSPAQSSTMDSSAFGRSPETTNDDDDDDTHTTDDDVEREGRDGQRVHAAGHNVVHSFSSVEPTFEEDPTLSHTASHTMSHTLSGTLSSATSTIPGIMSGTLTTNTTATGEIEMEMHEDFIAGCVVAEASASSGDASSEGSSDRTPPQVNNSPKKGSLRASEFFLSASSTESHRPDASTPTGSEPLHADGGTEYTDTNQTTCLPALDGEVKSVDVEETTPRSRVPGGAAAKLMLLGRYESDDASSAANSSKVNGVRSNEADVDAAPSVDSAIHEDSLKEIERVMNQTREEFAKGRQANRRYKKDEQNAASTTGTGNSSDSSEAKESEAASGTPSFLNRSEIFHKTASAAIAALLSPRGPASSLLDANSAAGAAAVRSVASSDLHQAGSTVSNSSSAFQTPDGASRTQADSSYKTYGRRSVSESLLQPRTERKLEAMQKRMHDPNKTMTDLLVAIGTPSGGPECMDLGFMVRRKNACGALKVMTNDSRKRLRICWTVGVLPALTSVLTEGAGKSLEDVYPDYRIRAEYEAARDRAIQAIQNLSIPKENRIPVFHTPGLVQALLAIIDTDEGLARKGCTEILAYLSKTPDNRLVLAQIPGVIDNAVHILKPKPLLVEPLNVKPRKKNKAYPWTVSSDETDSSRSSSSDSNASGAVHEDQHPMAPSVEISGYDESADEFLRASRQNVFALLIQLGKEKDNAYHFARDTVLFRTLIEIAGYFGSPSHAWAVKTLANLTRHRQNTKLMVFQERATVPALVAAANSSNDEARLFACYAIQNMAQDRACRQELAMVDGLVTTLCKRGRYANDTDERLAAISALKNLCDEPANLIPLTNTPECIATLMHLAHGKETGVTELMQYRACDALATLSHWLRKIATSGKSLDRVQRGLPADNSLFVPSLRVVTWSQWQ